MTSKAAYDDVPLALQDCKDIINFFQEAYGVSKAKIYERHNTDSKSLVKVYMELNKLLKDTKKNRLIMHVFAGHGV